MYYEIDGDNDNKCSTSSENLTTQLTVNATMSHSAIQKHDSIQAIVAIKCEAAPKTQLRHLSRFLEKTMCANKIDKVKSLKYLSLEVEFKLQVAPLMYKINSYNISDVRN